MIAEFATFCPYCMSRADLVTGKEVYPHRPDLYAKKFYQCKPCGAFVGCHPGTDNPLGRLANAELRKAKMAAHAAFDPIWQDKRGAKSRKRKEAYYWLSKQLGIPYGEAHIGMFDLELCNKTVEVCKSKA